MGPELLDDDYDGYREHEESDEPDESSWRFTCTSCKEIVGWDEWSYTARVCYPCKGSVAAPAREFEELRELVEEVV